MSATDLRQEAADASADFIVAHGEAPLTRDQAFVAGYLAAAEPPTVGIADLEVALADACREFKKITDALEAELESRDQRIRKLTDAAKAVVEGPRDPWIAINALSSLLEGAEAE